jgi:sugar phosphate isomerase/epimerase
MNLSRRAFFGTAAAALKPASAKSLDVIGVQLYTVRSVLPDKPAETLQELDKVGYREAEAVQAGLDKIWPSLVKTRLKPVSIHVDQAVFAEGREADLDAAIADAKRRGFAYFVYPYLPPPQRSGIDGIRRLAARLNRAAEKCRAAGMHLCYHNHAFEFDPKVGKLPMDVLMEETSKDLVGLELDIFWVKVAGHDPVAMLKQYSGRVPLLHLKNVAAGTDVRYNESVPRTAFKEVGAGVLDIPAILRAGDAAGVKHWFVEQDQTPGDPVGSLRQSFDYLKKLNY